MLGSRGRGERWKRYLGDVEFLEREEATEVDDVEEADEEGVLERSKSNAVAS